jgi:hypothetical protein
MPARHEAFFLNIQETQPMWKIAVGFVIFAAIALFVIMQAGDKVDMSGETHSGDVTHAAEPAAKQ